MRHSATAVLALVAVTITVGLAQFDSVPEAQAGILGSLGGTACKVLGAVGEGWWGKACGGALNVGGKLLGGGKTVVGTIGKVAGSPLVQRGAALAAVLAWVLGGAKWTMDHVASVISATTSPSLTASWFTGVYLRVEAIALFFTLLFVFAAAVEAIVRSELSLVARAVAVQLPLAALMTAVAVPLTMLVLAISDRFSSGLATIAGGGSAQFLSGARTWVVAGLTAADPFFAVLAGGLVVAAGCALWVEMLVREIAVYVVVAMLPLVFAGMVWPARRIWAIRTVEVLVAIVFAKVAIVVVLALGGAALSHAGVTGISKLLAGLALVILGAFSPWLLLRLIPMAEMASAAVGHIRGHVHATVGVRTPEAALTSRASARIGDHGHHGPSRDGSLLATAGGAAAVGELLERMHRRATTTGVASQPTADVAPMQNARGMRGAALARDHAPQHGSRSPEAARAVDPGVPEQTRVQQHDGSWEPLRLPDQDEVIPPAPWEAHRHESSMPSDAESPATQPNQTRPPQGQLFDDEGRW